MSNTRYSVRQPSAPYPEAHLLYVSVSRYGVDWKSIPHTHYFTELLLVTKGSGSFRAGEKSYPLEAGRLVIIPPYVEHTECSSEENPLEYFVLGIEGVSFLQSEEQPSIMTYDVRKDSGITELFQQIHQEIRSNLYGSEAICQHLLEVLILKLIRFWRLVPVANESLNLMKECFQIKEYLDTNYAEHITLDTLTRLTHINKYYMVHAFTKCMGISPIQYLNKRRLEIACHLLETSDHSIVDIASLTGFSSQSYFSQAFRKAYGTSPVGYRQRGKE
ncbi:MAG: AraC family transcriptional regulator [Lachnospiraceae bacterium]|nr:AraC family transcriptional regulator [Lachnospiraceae bacterium]